MTSEINMLCIFFGVNLILGVERYICESGLKDYHQDHDMIRFWIRKNKRLIVWEHKKSHRIITRSELRRLAMQIENEN
jgi:hypothetical protein